MSVGGPGRADAISRAIIASAMQELASAGQADFAMDRVAKGAYCSVGSVYERWNDRGQLLADLAAGPITELIREALGERDDARDAIEWVLAEGNTTLLLAGESLLAGHTTPAVRAPAVALWETLESGLARNMPKPLAWYVATYAVGSALLGALGVQVHDPDAQRVRWIADACGDAQTGDAKRANVLSTDAVELPVVPDPSRGDDVSLALIAAAQALLSERGAEGTTTRDIAAGAGVTTGALYRRYEGKSGLLADVLVTQLEPDRYTWTWDLVQALASGDPVGQSAAVLAQRMVDVAQDLPAQQVLLQVGIAARNDPALRAQVVERIRVAHQARVDMVRHFADAGLLRTDVSAEVMAWGLQVIPVGVRATLPLGVPLDVEQVAAASSALLAASVARSD